jgi:hypothetical protein
MTIIGHRFVKTGEKAESGIMREKGGGIQRLVVLMAGFADVEGVKLGGTACRKMSGDASVEVPQNLRVDSQSVYIRIDTPTESTLTFRS